MKTVYLKQFTKDIDRLTNQDIKNGVVAIIDEIEQA